MSDTIERNDVDINRLFNWGRVFELISDDGNEPILIYMKLLGDADLNRARTHAMRKSAELRRKLKDENSDERLAWIKSLDEVKTEELINLTIVFSTRQITTNARNKINVPTPKPPKSTASLEKMEKYQKEVDDYPAKKTKAIEEIIKNEIETLRKSLEGRPKEELYREYVKQLIDELCEREAIGAFEDMQVFFGCYQDDSYKPDKRFFKDFDEFDNLEPTIKGQFKDAFRSIDIDHSELKKLRRATP